MRFCGRLLAAARLFVFVTFYIALGHAQLSTSLGGSVSEPLDTNLNGLSSTVAPIPSSTIEPGANSLLTPDEHILPYDAIGASIIATPLSPAVTQSYVLSRVPFQVDNSLRDASIITGLHPAQPINIVDVIAGKSHGSANVGALSTLSLRSTRDKSASELKSTSITQQSFWKVGSALSAASMLNPIDQLPQGPIQQSGKFLTRDAKQKSQNESRFGIHQPVEHVEDSSRSPLEKMPVDSEDTVGLSASPFDNLEQKSFLSPDITATPSQYNGSRKRGMTLFSDRAQSESFMHRQAELSQLRPTRQMKDQKTAGTDSRTKKPVSSIGQATKPRWHNPILQQMENDTSSARR
jgi:hypothetical protein